MFGYARKILSTTSTATARRYKACKDAPSSTPSVFDRAVSACLVLLDGRHCLQALQVFPKLEDVTRIEASFAGAVFHTTRRPPKHKNKTEKAERPSAKDVYRIIRILLYNGDQKVKRPCWLVFESMGTERTKIFTRSLL